MHSPVLGGREGTAVGPAPCRRGGDGGRGLPGCRHHHVFAGCEVQGLTAGAGLGLAGAVGLSAGLGLGQIAALGTLLALMGLRRCRG